MVKYTQLISRQRIFITTLKMLLAKLAKRYGRPVLWLYALLFLLLMTGMLTAVYLLFGALILESPNGVLLLTGLLVVLILYVNRRRQ